MRTSAKGIAFIKRFEGFSATPYDDGVGVRTIGYGTTAADVSPLPHHLTEQQATRLLIERIAAKYEPPVRALFHGRHPLPFNQHRFDALVSFVYNLGPGAVQGVPGFETMGRALHAARHDHSPRALRAVADAMLLYSNPGDPAVHAGLLRRRREERRMFLASVRRSPR